MSYSVLVVDDHPIFRRGMASVLQSDHRFSLVGESHDGEVAAQLFASLDPDVVLVSLSPSGTAHVEGIERIRAVKASASVISVTSCAHCEDIHPLLRAGARGYIRRDATVSELLKCVLCVAEGGRYLTPAAISTLADTVWSDALSPRELDILRLISTGKSNRAIGKSAGISEETVKSHVNKILSKLDVTSRTEAVSVAVRRGVIQLV